MNSMLSIKLKLLCILFSITQLSFAQILIQDSLKEISIIGIFDGKKVQVGNFDIAEVYKINEYCISLTDISENQLSSFKGKKVLVTGFLKIIVGSTHSAKTSTDGKIYEPYKEPDKKYIVNPKFTIYYDSREPIINN